MAHRLPRLAAAVLLALTSAGCPDDSVPTTPMPGGLDLAALLPAQRELVRVTLEVSGGALAETELDLDDDLKTLSGTFDVQNVTAPTAREFQLRVYGRFAEDSEEVLLGRLLKPITLQPEADVAIAFSADDTFDSCGGEPGACAILFDANRNGISNIDDLLERERSGGLGIDPAPQAPYLVTSSEQLQFPSGVRLGSFARQLVVLENFGEHQVEITSAAVVGGQGFAISILDPTGQSVAPPGRTLVGGSFEGIAPGQEAFIAVSFSPVNSFVTTGALFVRVRDTVTLVEQTARVKLIANPEGELRPVDITYTEPELDAITVEGGEIQLTAFPNAQLQSGDAIIAEDALGAGLRQTGASVELVDGDFTVDFPTDAAFAVTVRAGERFSTAFDGLTSDIDIAVVDIADGAIAGLACVDCRSANAGTSPEAVEFKNDTSTSRTVAVLIGRIEPEVVLPQTDGGLTVAETVSFRCSTTVSVGPEFADADPVQPTTGPLEGGIPVRLRGSGFDPRARVFVGQAEALDVAIESGADGVDIVTFTLPAAVGTENPASIIVENPNDPGDGQAATLLESFTYQPPAPVIDEIRPDLAPTTGGDTAITIAGRFFSTRHGPPFVTFGTVTVAATFVSSSELTVTAPPHVNPNSAATVSVKVRNRIAPDVDGAPVVGSASNGVAFRYLVPAGAPPTIVGVNPAVGSVDGGTRVSIEGTDLRPGLRVFFGSREASCDAPNTTAAVSCLTPAADEPVSVDVIVVNADAQSARRDGGYRYEIPAPFVTSVFPPRGITDGGTFLVVEGGGFRPGARVTFVQGETVRDATAASRVSGTTMLVTTPPGTAGAAQLVIRNLDGQSVDGSFSYFAPDAATPPPSITAVNPAVGDAAGGYPVVITGTGFLSPTVLFGSRSVEATFVDRTPPDLDELTVTAPTSPTGVAAAVTVQVVNDDGQSAASGFNYTFSAAAPPRIDRISPSTFTTGQTTAFTVSGARFDAGAVVLVGGLQAAITARSSTSISASIGGQLPLGAVQVVVENPNGSAVSIPVQVVSPTGVVQPAISAVSTSDVHADVAGDVITLFGAGLDQGAASVQVAAVGQADPARPARVLVQNANFLVVELPAIPPGPRVLQASFDTASGTRTALSPTVTAQAPVVVFADGDTREDGRVDVVMLGDFLHPAALTSVVLDNAEPLDCNIAVATERVIRCTTVAPLAAGSTYELGLTWTGSFAGAAQPSLRRAGQDVGFDEPINGPTLEIVDLEEPIRGRTDFAIVPQTVTLTVPGLDPARLPTGAVFEVVVGNRGEQPGSPDVFAARGDAIVEVDVVTTTLDLGVLQFFGLDELPVSLLANGREVAFGFVAAATRTVSAGSVGVAWSQGFDVALDAGLPGDENRVVAVRQQDRQIVVPLVATRAGADLTVADTRSLAPGVWLACLADQVSFCDSTSNATFFVSGLEQELEPNDTPQTANGVFPFGSVNGTVNGTVASPDVDQYFFRVDDPVQGYRLSVVRGCTPGMTARLSVRASGVTIIDDACASASPPVNLPPDEYLITVATSVGEPSTYQLQLGSSGGEGECGNGIVEPGEQCDEGGSFLAQCDPFCLESVEASDFGGGLEIGSVPAFGARTLAVNDTDVFTFFVSEAGSHQVTVTSRNGEGCNGAFAGVLIDGQLLELDFFGCVSAQLQLEQGVHRLEVVGSLLPFKYQVAVSRQSGGQCGNGFLDPGEQCDEGANNGVPVLVGGETQLICDSICTEPPPADMVLDLVNVPRTLTLGDVEFVGVNVPTRVTLNVFTTLRDGTEVNNACAERIRLIILDSDGRQLITSTSGNGGCAFASVVVPPGRYVARLEATNPNDTLRTLVGSFQTEAPPEAPCGNGFIDPAAPPSGNGLRTDLAGELAFFGGVAAGVTVDGDGTAYIVENNVGRIRRRTAAGIETTLVPSPATLQNGADIELGPDGFLYVADGFGLNFQNGGAANRVLRVDRVSGTSTQFASSVNNPSGLAFDAAGNLLVASFSDQRISRFAPDGTPLGQFGPQLPVLPNDIEVRADGTIMIAGFNPDLTPATKVFQMSPDGSTVSTFADSGTPTIHDPHSLVFDGAGALWVTFYNGQTLARFAPDGALLQTVPGGFAGPDLPNGIAIDRTGSLYVVLNASVLYRLDNLAAGFGEACDDGDASSGDGCSSVCTIEPGFVCSGQPGVCVVDTCRNPALDPLNDCEVDDLIEAVNLPIGVRSTRAITGGDADFFKFTVPPGVNSLVSIFDNVSGCAGNGFELEAFQSGSSAGTLTLFGGCYQERFPANAALPPGTYVMRVTGRDGVPVPSYEFAVANCGDGRQEFFESCDDGNTGDGDGCSSSCQQEPDFLCTGSPSTCSQVICQSVDLTTQPGAPFLAASGTFSGNGYQPGVRANMLSTEDLAFPVSVSVDVDWGASVGEIGFVGVRSSGLPVGATEEPEDSVYLRLHVGIGANQADLAVGPSPFTIPTAGTMPSPQFGVYGVRMTDDGVNVSARIINLQQPGVPPLVLKTSTPVQPAPGNNRVVFGGQSVLFRNATVCQRAP